MARRRGGVPDSMREGRSAAGNQEPGTPGARGTPWKGRLRSHHETPQSVPTQRVSSRAMNREETKEVPTPKDKEQATRQNKGRGCNAGAPQRRSPRLTSSDPENPIIIDEANEEFKGRDNQSAIKPLRRSPRLQPENKSLGEQVQLPHSREIPHNRKTEKTLRKDESQKSLERNKRNSEIKRQKKLQENCQGTEDIPPRNKIADVSHKKSGKQEAMPNDCEVLTRKRKRGTREKSSKGQRTQDPPDCKEIAPSNESRKSIVRKIQKDPPIIRHPNIGDESNKVASDDWTEEQDMALRNAYFSARPSPHFWKKVSKMVPGRSAEECFNRIHADLSTPTPIASRPRKSKTYSPLGKFTLSDAKLPNILETTVVRQRTAKRKSLAAQKTVRHLLRKHCLSDQAQEADHFSIFETSPSAIQLNISFEDSPGTPDNDLSSGSLNKCSGSSYAQKKPLSRLRTKESKPSPAVLKPVKNVILHERYINQLSRREGAKRPRKRTPGSKAADDENCFSEKQANGLKAAKNALISEATDFIGHFKKLQANSHVHILLPLPVLSQPPSSRGAQARRFDHGGPSLPLSPPPCNGATAVVARLAAPVAAQRSLPCSPSCAMVHRASTMARPAIRPWRSRRFDHGAVLFPSPFSVSPLRHFSLPFLFYSSMRRPTSAAGRARHRLRVAEEAAASSFLAPSPSLNSSSTHMLPQLPTTPWPSRGSGRCRH